MRTDWKRGRSITSGNRRQARSGRLEEHLGVRVCCGADGRERQQATANREEEWREANREEEWRERGRRVPRCGLMCLDLGVESGRAEVWGSALTNPTSTSAGPMATVKKYDQTQRWRGSTSMSTNTTPSHRPRHDVLARRVFGRFPENVSSGDYL